MLTNLLNLIALLFLGLALALALTTWFIAHRLRNPPRKTYSSAVARNLPGDPSELQHPRPFAEYTLRLAAPRAQRTVHVWSIEGDDPAGPVVIATPGWGDSRLGVLPRLGRGDDDPGLASAASRVIAWDPPGQGESPGRCALGTDEPHLIARLIDHAREQHPHAPVVLFGWSLGAGASIVAAALKEHDETPVAAVIAEAPYRFPMVPAKNVISQAGYPTFTLPVLYTLLALRLRVGRSPRWERAHHSEPFDRAHHAANLRRTSLTLIHGELDAVSPPQDSRDIAAAATACDATLHEIPDAAHNDLWTDARFRPVVGRAARAAIASAATPSG